MEHIVVSPRRRKPFISYTMYAFSKQELEALLASCERMSDYIMILIASRYGIRREDIVGIKISNVNLQDHTLTYYEHKKKRDRFVTLEQDVEVDLKRYLNSVKKGQTLLLPFGHGTTAWHHLQEICRIAKIPVPAGRTGRPFHSLRGTCVKMRQAQGWNLNEVAALIGDDVDTVAKHYATVTPAELATKMRGCTQQ